MPLASGPELHHWDFDGTAAAAVYRGGQCVQETCVKTLAARFGGCSRPDANPAEIRRPGAGHCAATPISPAITLAISARVASHVITGYGRGSVVSCTNQKPGSRASFSTVLQ